MYDETFVIRWLSDGHIQPHGKVTAYYGNVSVQIVNNTPKLRRVQLRSWCDDDNDEREKEGRGRGRVILMSAPVPVTEHFTQWTLRVQAPPQKSSNKEKAATPCYLLPRKCKETSWDDLWAGYRLPFSTLYESEHGHDPVPTTSKKTFSITVISK